MKYYANLLDKIQELEEELKSNQLWCHLVNSEDVYSTVQCTDSSRCTETKHIVYYRLPAQCELKIVLTVLGNQHDTRRLRWVMQKLLLENFFSEGLVAFWHSFCYYFFAFIHAISHSNDFSCSRWSPLKDFFIAIGQSKGTVPGQDSNPGLPYTNHKYRISSFRWWVGRPISCLLPRETGDLSFRGEKKNYGNKKKPLVDTYSKIS